MQTTGGINQYHIGIIGLGRTECIEGHTGGIGTHLLLDNRNTYALSPNAQLFNGSGAEGISGTQIDLLTGLLELIGQLTDGGGLTHSIHTYYQNDVGLVVGGKVPVIIIVRVVL